MMAPDHPDSGLQHATTRPSLLARACILLVRFYQATLSPFVGGHCRFSPTCSRYAIEAYQRHGAFRGTWLTLRRLLRCHPLGGFGYDPVPGTADDPPPHPHAKDPDP